ncbi:hypothetical protein [Mycoplasma leachii]|uniref:hypothetical protein n=1 Tax=Mycoplasma leachii TaxID=2105 RepID=UPI003DA5B100
MSWLNSLVRINIFPISSTFETSHLSKGDIKKQLASKLKVNESDLQELKADSTNGIGAGSVRSKTFVGTLEFKFEIEENRNILKSLVIMFL